MTFPQPPRQRLPPSTPTRSAGKALHPCPECGTLSIATPEQKGAIHLDCPVCLYGRVFRDARGGYECRSGKRGCDTGSPEYFRGRPGCGQRFLVHEPHPNDPYGGPEHVGGPLRWWERPASGWGLLAFLSAFALVLWLVPVPYWSLFFLASLAWEHWFKKLRESKKR